MKSSLLLTTALVAIVGTAQAAPTKVVVTDGDNYTTSEDVYSGYSVSADKVGYGSVFQNAGNLTVKDNTIFKDNT